MVAVALTKVRAAFQRYAKGVVAMKLPALRVLNAIPLLVFASVIGIGSAGFAKSRANTDIAAGAEQQQQQQRNSQNTLVSSTLLQQTAAPQITVAGQVNTGTSASDSAVAAIWQGQESPVKSYSRRYHFHF
jgi:hypothetical protein